jgi:hypothetical protein
LKVKARPASRARGKYFNTREGVSGRLGVAKGRTRNIIGNLRRTNLARLAHGRRKRVASVTRVTEILRRLYYASVPAAVNGGRNRLLDRSRSTGARRSQFNPPLSPDSA